MLYSVLYNLSTIDIKSDTVMEEFEAIQQVPISFSPAVNTGI
jgi:hypothetical protein